MIRKITCVGLGIYMVAALGFALGNIAGLFGWGEGSLNEGMEFFFQSFVCSGLLALLYQYDE